MAKNDTSAVNAVNDDETDTQDQVTTEDQVTENQVTEDQVTEYTGEAEPEIAFEDLPAEQQVGILQQKLAQSANDVLRAIADVQNMRKRTDEEIAKHRKYGCAMLARDLFSVADNLRMAVASISEDDKKNIPALHNLSIGLDMVVSEFNNAFDRNGIKQILPNTGDAFDPNIHQAMGETESTDTEAGKIAFVMSAGYTLHDRLLKPAMVNVAKTPDTKDTQDENDST